MKVRYFMPIVREAEESSAEREITRAVKRVYERYGSDLNAFMRDVLKETEKRRETAEPAAGSGR